MGITKYDVRNVYIISVTRYTFIFVMEDVVCCIDIDIYIKRRSRSIAAHICRYSNEVDCKEFPNGGSRYLRVLWVHINPHNNILISNQTSVLTYVSFA